MKNWLKKFLIILLLVIFSFNANTLVKADSGWDFDYDSGGWNSSGWDSGGWDSGSSWSSSDGYSSSGSFTDLIIGVLIVVFFTMILMMLARDKSSVKYRSIYLNESESNNYQELSEEELAKYGLRTCELKKITYDLYVDVQKAWSDMDDDELRTKLTDELYNSYIMQLGTLKLKQQKNIINGFEYIDAKVIDVSESNGLLNIRVYLNVKMHDYVVDKDNKTIRGSALRLNDVEYIITLVKTSTNNKDEKLLCPNCGAEIKLTSGGTCEYCGSTIVIDAKDFVMSSKTCIGQK